MIFDIAYHHLVVKDDIPKITNVWKKKIRQAIRDKLTTKPEVFGKPLRKSLKGYRTLRVGDYRVVFRIEGNIVKIFVIKRRSGVYELI